MGDFKITFGDAAANRTISDDELKAISQKTKFEDEKHKSIFTKAFDKNDDGVIDETELSEGLGILKKSAAADGITDNLSDDEARAFLAQHNIEDARVEDLYGFFNKAKEISAAQVEQAQGQDEAQAGDHTEEHAEETPADKGKVYAKNGETFDQTAKRLGFEKGTEEYNEFVKANQKAAKKHWFRLGVEINIPESLKDKVKDEAYGVDRKEEEAKYKEAVKAKNPPKAVSTSRTPSRPAPAGTTTGTRRTEGSVTPPAPKKSTGKKGVSKDNLKASNYKGVFYDTKTKTHYIEQDGKMVEWRPSKEMADNEKVVKVNNDGSFVTQWKCTDGTVCRSTYNKEGRETGRVFGKSSEKFEADGTYYIYDLDHPGYLKQRKYYDGEIAVFKNNDDGSYTGTRYSADGSVICNFANDNEGRTTWKRYPSGETWTYEYNDDGSYVSTGRTPGGSIMKYFYAADGDSTGYKVIRRGSDYHGETKYVDDKRYKETRRQGIWYEPASKLYYTEQGGKMVEYRPNSISANEHVVRVLEDGSYVTEWKCKFGEINRSYYNSRGKETKRVWGNSSEKFVRSKVQIGERIARKVDNIIENHE